MQNIENTWNLKMCDYPEPLKIHGTWFMVTQNHWKYEEHDMCPPKPCNNHPKNHWKYIEHHLCSPKTIENTRHMIYDHLKSIESTRNMICDLPKPLKTHRTWFMITQNHLKYKEHDLWQSKTIEYIICNVPFLQIFFASNLQTL